MTRQKSFKRLVRARMEKTGESYTAARAMLLSAEETKAPAGPTLTMSEESIRRRTGRGWEEWFDLLDESGAGDWSHAEIARWLSAEQGVAGWDAQSVTVGYERERTAKRPKSARFDWGHGRTGVNVGFESKGEVKSTVALEHARLADADEADRMKAFWRERLAALKSQLEGGAF
jgi:hypothetical protein